ncbi:MAG: LirA/MavJ family T4SS effector [Blastocatellia bacterium]
MPREQDIIAELDKTRLPRDSQISQVYFDDVVAAQLFLTSQTAMANALKDLNDKLKDKLKQRKQANDQDPFANLLNGTLGEFEKEKGFAIYEIEERMKVITLTGNLSSEGFGKTLAEGRPFKDYVGRDHGVHTHRIQWYCLQFAGLKTTWLVDLYKHLGTYAKGEGWKPAWRDAWYVTFDRQKENFNNGQGLNLTLEPAQDFRRPETLNLYLLNEGAIRYDILSSCLSNINGRSGLDNNIKYLLVLKYKFGYQGLPKGWKTASPPELKKMLETAKGTLSSTQLKEFNEYIAGKSPDTDKHLFYPKAGGSMGVTQTVAPTIKPGPGK